MTDLLVVGELNADLIVRGGDVVPAFGQAERLVEHADLVLGSSGAITACGAARLGLSVTFAGVAGDDLLGRFVLEALSERGVECARVELRRGGRTGLGVVLVRAGGDRATLTFPGLIGALRAEHVGREAFAGVRHVHVSSPFLQTALRPGLAGLLRAARAAGATTSTDPNWDPSGRWDLDDVLPHLDLLLPNAEEAARLTGEPDPGRAARRLAAAGPAVAVTLGAEGALLHDGGDASRVRAPADIEVLDTTGAGDTFTAGFLAAWLDGRRGPGALALGCAAAALSLRAAGGTAGQPARDEAEALAATLVTEADDRAERAIAPGTPARSPAPDTPARPPGTAPHPHAPNGPARVPGPASATRAELTSQPAMWRHAASLPAAEFAKLPRPGARVLAIGCGTSFHVLDAYAARRRLLDGSVTRAAICSELDEREDYDAVLLLSRSGTTSDQLRVAEHLRGRTPTAAIVGDPDSPLPDAVDAAVLLPFADERSVVQTRFATTALALLRRSLGEDLEPASADAEAALAAPPVAEPLAFGHVVFLGTGWTLGIAHEAALKCREAALMFTEAYAVGEYEHGPVALAGPHTLVWSLCPLPDRLRALLAGTGATVREPAWDPMAELVAVHRLAVATAEAKGLDPDHPRHLNRSVVLEG